MSSDGPGHILACRFVLAAIALASLANNVSAGEHNSLEKAARGPFHVASVAKNVLTLPSLPGFRLYVADAFTYLGSTSFPLGDRAEADVFLFAEEDGDSITRFVKVQVESLVDDAAKGYAWEGVDTLLVAGAEYVRGYWCFDAAKAALERPESDTARTQEWLTASGHSQTGVFVGTRLARVFANGRSEILLFYGETTKRTGIDCADEDTAQKHLPSIVARSDEAFRLGE